MIPSTVIRSTPEALRTPISETFMRAYNSPAVERLGQVTAHVDKALRSSHSGWGTAPQAQVGRAIGTIDSLPPLQSVQARDSVTFASELLRNALAGRQGNAPEVLDFRRTALIQAQAAASSAAQHEATTLMTGRIGPPHSLTL